MANAEKQRDRLVALLSDLFQLNQPDLDFGFYRIMHAKADRVSSFLQNDLLKIIKDAFGEADDKRVEEARLAYEAAIKQAKDFGAPNPEETKPVKKAKAAYDAVRDAGNGEGEVYDHLYRFFERYYDNGDFMSRRYYARETDGKAAPYSVPYDGREVYLHWANRDQYYIKTSEYLTNFTFNLANAPELKGLFEQEVRKVHCRIVEAAEGEHGNVKTTDKTERYFLIHKEEPIKLENGDIVIQFEYRPDAEKIGQGGKWQEKRIDEAEKSVMDALKRLKEADVFVAPLATMVGNDGSRTLMRRYLNQYTSRNTMDYFIHKDLGGFMRRELDFYIKNEIMRLDDIESADVPRVDFYLSKIKVLRKISHHLIDFLAQLEAFQKKLWLKKKFVVETNYCITLDRVPESFYPEITTNDKQREEWVKLFAIDDLKGYKKTISVEFLKENPFLVLDTALFDEAFKAKLLGEIQDLDGKLNGLLVHSDNSQGLRFVKDRFSREVQCTYIDPPYNTGNDGFLYKDSFKSSSWTSMMYERLLALDPLLSDTGVIFCSINEIQRAHLDWCMQSVFGAENRVEELIWARDTVSNNSPAYSTNHEYIEVFAHSKARVEAERNMFREEKPGYAEVCQIIVELGPSFPPISEIESAIKSLYAEHKNSCLIEGTESGLSKEDAQKADPWKGLYPYKYAEYRDANGCIVSEANARVSKASIWVYREVEPSMPSGKQASDIKDANSENYRFYSPKHPVTQNPCKPPKRGWAFPEKSIGSRPSFEKYFADNRIVFKSDEKSIPQLKYFLHEVSSAVSTSVIRQYSDGEPKLEAMFGVKGLIDNPKPPALIEKLVRQTTQKNSIVLDFFAGSGTTASSVVEANRKDGGQRQFILMEAGNYFDTALKPRVVKSSYSAEWADGKPVSHDGISHCFKYLRLETYEDALNNLTFREDATRNQALTKNDEFRRDYMLKYWLDFETKGSPSLLSVQQFADPTAYMLKIKKPGSDEYVEKSVDLIETFNWLIALHVDHIDAPRIFGGKFKREADPELPNDQTTRLIIDGKLAEDANGKWWFRKVEGRVCRTPGDKKNMDKVLIIWRKLTDNLEEDNLMLDEWFKKYRLSTQDSEFDVIYVNGSNNLPNLKRTDENWKVCLIEEAFHQKMWDVEG